MKTSTEFPGVYRVSSRIGPSGFPWWLLERLHLGAFCYSWREADRWLKEPTKEQVSKAIEDDRKARLEAEHHASFKPYFVTPEAPA